jgi:hypothetical protein
LDRFKEKRERPLESLSSVALSLVLVRERPNMDGKAFPKALLVSGRSRGCCWSGSWRFREGVSKRLLFRLGVGRDGGEAESSVDERDITMPPLELGRLKTFKDGAADHRRLSSMLWNKTKSLLGETYEI